MFDDFDDELMDEGDVAVSAPAGEGLQPPRQMADCLGHESVEKTLLEAIEGGRMPHALIFAGPQGIGKATMAFRLARYLLKTGSGGESADGGLFGDVLPRAAPETLFVAPDDPVFRQVVSGGHPDLLTIERLFDEKNSRFKASVEVDEARRITPFMRKTASQGGWRIVIVDDADTMNRNAQNAILKILEEPPANALLILISHRLGAMIPTIRSRCRTIHFAPPNQESFAKLVRRDHGGLPDSDMKLLYGISGGSIGQAVRICTEGGLETIGKIMTLLHGWPQWQWSQIHMLAETISRPGQEDGLRTFEDVFLWIIDSLLRAKARGEALPPALDNEATRKLLQHYSLTAWIEITGQIREHFDTVSAASLDKRHAVLGAFSIFEGREAA